MELLTSFREKSQHKQSTEGTRMEKVRQLVEAQNQLQGNLKENSFQEMTNRMVEELEEKILALRESILVETHLSFECNRIELEECICNFGDTVERRGVKTNYAAFQSQIAVGAIENILPFGIAIDNITNQIFVAEHTHSGIQIFDENGILLKHFGEQKLKCPWGIAIDQLHVYVCDWGHHALFRFKLTDLSCVNSIGKFGPENGEFKWPRQITVSPDGSIFVADCFNHRICIFEPELIHVRNITHDSIVFPTDVKTTREHIYILTERKTMCMHVFTPTGEHVNSIITIGQGMDVELGWFFCLDVHNNFLISDMGANCIKVFSKDGQLVQKVGVIEDKGVLIECKGIAFSLAGKIICVSNTKYACLQIFY
ncbi:RING finger protein nhl-1-like [Oopsacas minuta]|uniref:RING finger protein nhl-1-like n=1 Tax=Oopsacas minuta TaxID=111878 RepID=A0AAV7KAX6_9METZ|nr:RING finger protein nhl-1-like [Oopsacas minuta]